MDQPKAVPQCPLTDLEYRRRREAAPRLLPLLVTKEGSLVLLTQKEHVLSGRRKKGVKFTFVICDKQSDTFDIANTQKASTANPTPQGMSPLFHQTIF